MFGVCAGEGVFNSSAPGGRRRCGLSWVDGRVRVRRLGGADQWVGAGVWTRADVPGPAVG